MNREGFIPIQSPLVPNNDNPRSFVTENSLIKGAPIIAQSIDELVAHHPNRMVKGNKATVYNFPSVGSVSDFVLNTDPSQLLDGSGNSIITSDNFSSFWEVQGQTITSGRRVQQFSPDGPGGGAPVYPYTLSEETNWSNTYDASKGHRWTRFRDDDVDDNNDGIYDNWTLPIPINSSFSTGDYIANMWKRQAVSSTVHSAEGTLINTKYYIVETGSIRIQGTISLNDTGDFVNTSDITLGVGRTFKYVPGNTYTFNVGCTLTETIQTPPRSIGGLTNDSPSGWTDTIPAGSAQLWEITGQKSMYGKLKSAWVLKKVVENPNYFRYSNSPIPDPGTIAGVNTTVTNGSAEDLSLISAGWERVYNQQDFIARRSDDPGVNLYTPWIVEKINEESGEYTDRVFKLFSVNLDSDSPSVAPPSGRDPSSQGWTDSPQQETDTEINFVSEARKFYDGTLKTPWSQPVPYTGKDAFNDYIDSSPADNFKYDQNGGVTPSTLTLTAFLNKGVTKIWENNQVTISYSWKVVFDNGGIVSNTITSTNPADDIYLLGATGTPGSPGWLRSTQRIVFKPAGVNGTTVVRCTQTVTFPTGDPLTFEEEFTIIDVTDGKDAKSLVVTTDIERVVWDTVNSVFNPVDVTMRAYQANLGSPTLYWYKYNTGTLAWDAISNGATYTITGSTCKITSLTGAGFAADSTSQKLMFCVSTKNSSPETADYDTDFTDYQTIVKLSSLSTGAAGVNALTSILSNESHTIVLNSQTGLPQTDEVGVNKKAVTEVSLYDGTTQKAYGTDWTINIPAVTGVTFQVDDLGNTAKVTILTWAANLLSATVNIDITYGTFVIRKVFSVTTTKDAPGGLIFDIDSTSGYVWSNGDTSSKTVSCRLYDTNLAGTQEVAYDGTYEFRLNAGTWQTSNSFSIAVPGIGVTNVVHTFYVRKASAPGVILRSRNINFTKVQSGKIHIAWSDSNVSISTARTNSLTSQSTLAPGTSVTVGSVVWYDYKDTYWSTHVAKFQQLGEEDAGGSFSWSIATQVTGEKGDQGNQGGFLFSMYKQVAAGVTPTLTNSWTISQMNSNGWTAKPPGSVSGQIMWFSQRIMVSQIGSGSPVQFDGSGYPYYDGTPGNYDSGLTADPWGAPVQLTGKTGTDGVSVVGAPGPGYTSVTELAPSPNGDRNYRLDPVNGASPGFFTSPKGDLGEVLYSFSGFLPADGFITALPAIYTGNFLAIITLGARDSGAAGAFHIAKNISFRNDLNLLAQGIEMHIYGDGFTGIKPPLFCTRFMYISGKTIKDWAPVPVAQAGGYDTVGSNAPTIDILLIRLKS